MDRNALVVAGVVVAGAGGYLYFAHRNGWWPFKEAVAPVTPPNPPGQPQVSVNVIDQNTAEASVSWDAVPGATYYKVFVNGQVAAGAESVQGTTATLHNLVPGQTYNIAVAACN